MDSMVAVIALNAAAKLLRVNPVGELRKNRFASVHSSSLAWPVLSKMPKRSSNRSHHFSCAVAHIQPLSTNSSQVNRMTMTSCRGN